MQESVERWKKYVVADGELSILGGTEVLFKAPHDACAWEAWRRRHFWRRRGMHLTIFTEQGFMFSTTHELAIDPFSLHD